MNRKINILLAALLSVGWLFAISPQAHGIEGLTAQVYNVQGQNNAPYIPEGDLPVLITNVSNINFDWGSDSVLGGPSEDVIVKFNGYILSNTTQDISFLVTGDDGTKLFLDGELITNDWYDKGGGGTISSPVSFTAGVPKTIELMYYENGGGANVFLHWDQSGSMDIIPSSAFTSQAAPVVKTIGAPRNLVVTDNETSTVLSWEAPNTGNTQPERYAISFSADGGGWGIATGNVGDANALNTTITINHSLLESLKPSGTVWSFHIRSDNDTLALYSENSNVVTLKIGKTAEEIQYELDAIKEQQRLEAEIAAAEVARLQAIEDARIAEEQRIAADAEAARQAVLAAKAEEERIAAELAAAKAEADRIAAEEAAARAEAERLAAEIAAKKAEEERIAAELAAAKAEADRIAAEEAAARAEEEARLAEEARLKAEEDARIAEEERLRAEEEAKIKEEERIKAEEEARIAEENRLKAEEEARLKAEEEERLEAERIAAEEAKAEAEENAKLKAEEEARLELERIKAEEEARIAEKLKEQAEKDKAIKDAQKIAESGQELSSEQKGLVAAILIEQALSSGETITKEQVQSSGIEYKDLPAETPVEIRTSESGEPLIITAEVAANVELVTDAGALLEAVFTDPGAAIAAIGSIGADMTEGEREEATDMVVATVVAAGAAMNAVGAAASSTGGSTSGGSSGGGSGGGGASGNSKGVRRRP